MDDINVILDDIIDRCDYFNEIFEVDDSEEIFLKATNNQVAKKRYQEIGHQGWDCDARHQDSRKPKGMMGYLFEPDIIESDDFQFGEDGTVDFSKYAAGAGFTAKELGSKRYNRNHEAHRRLVELSKLFTEDGEPQSFEAFIQGLQQNLFGVIPVNNMNFLKI